MTKSRKTDFQKFNIGRKNTKKWDKRWQNIQCVEYFISEKRPETHYNKALHKINEIIRKLDA